MRPSMSSSICRAQVGLGRPDRFPLGAATGTPAARITARARGWPGHRTPTVSRPQVTALGTFSRRWRTMVRGPGHTASARA